MDLATCSGGKRPKHARCLTFLLDDAPEKVGKIAAERTLRRLGARKAKTAQVPSTMSGMVICQGDSCGA